MLAFAVVSFISVTLASALAVAGAAEVSDNVFGRTCERQMRAEDGRYLDLDTGELLQDLPPGDLFRDFEESDLRIRVGKEMIAVPVAAERWNAGVDEVLRAVNKAPLREEVRFVGAESRGAWFFRTREGATGVLKILFREDQPDSVLVRYKRIRARRQFEPVTTVVLSPKGQPRLALTDSETDSLPGAKFQALAHRGAAHLERDPDEGWRVIVENMYHYSAAPEKGPRLWESMSAEGISEPTNIPPASLERKGYSLRENELPLVILLPQWGMLQIAEADVRDPTQPSVTLRYKRVAKTAGSGIAPELKAEAEWRFRRAKVEVKRGIALLPDKLTTEEVLTRLRVDVALLGAQLKGHELEVARIRFLQGQEQLLGWAEWHREGRITDAAYEDIVANVRRKYDLVLPDEP